jgi:hypothetical protein
MAAASFERKYRARLEATVAEWKPDEVKNNTVANGTKGGSAVVSFTNGIAENGIKSDTTADRTVVHCASLGSSQAREAVNADAAPSRTSGAAGADSKARRGRQRRAPSTAAIKEMVARLSHERSTRQRALPGGHSASTVSKSTAISATKAPASTHSSASPTLSPAAPAPPSSPPAEVRASCKRKLPEECAAPADSDMVKRPRTMGAKPSFSTVAVHSHPQMVSGGVRISAAGVYGAGRAGN